MRRREPTPIELGMSYGMVAGLAVASLMLAITGNAFLLVFGLPVGLLVGLAIGQLREQRSR